MIVSTLSAIRSLPRFCKMLSESSTVVTQFPCCPGKQGELPEKYLQNLPNDLMADSVLGRKYTRRECEIRTLLKVYTPRLSLECLIESECSSNIMCRQR